MLDTKAANGEHGLKYKLEKDNNFKSDIIKALNSINKVAPHISKQNQLNAASDNDYFLTFDGNRIITVFKPTRDLKQYFLMNLM